MKGITQYRGHLIILVLTSIFTYILVHSFIQIEVNESVMFSTTDSRGYKAVGSWLFGGPETVYISIRPILYPFIVGASLKIGGVFLLWFIQCSMWITTILLTFTSVVRATRKIFIGYISTIVLLTNLSFITMTYHALSEVMTILMIAILVSFILHKKTQHSSVRYLHIVLFLLSLLTIIKPSFYIFSIGFLVLICPLFIKQYLKKTSRLIWLGLTLSPIILQLSIVKFHSNEWTISTRSIETIDSYLLTQGLCVIEDISISESRAKIKLMSSSEKRNLLYDNKSVYLTKFMDNIFENIVSSSSFLDISNKGHLGPEKFTKIYNRITLYLHTIFTLLAIILVFVLYQRKEFSWLPVIFLLFSLNVFIIFSSGVAFWQGDRLVLIALPIWATLYPIIGFNFYHSVIRKKTIVFE